MRVTPADLQAKLTGKLAPVYVVFGEETLLAEEACTEIRNASRREGFEDRELMIVERGFDWDQLSQAGESLSLFSQKRLIELRMPGSKPGDKGSKAIVEFCGNVAEDTMLLLWCGKLDRTQLNSKWFKALDSVGISVGVQPVPAQQFPGWITQRLRRHGLEAGPGVAELLAYRYEGNLLAAAQEAEKLALIFDKTVSIEQIQGGISDDARFDVFGFVDTCLGGNGPAVVRALNGLRAEGVAPSLVLWAVTREIRLLEQCATGIASGDTENRVFSQFHVWQKKQDLFRAALKRGRPARWRALLQAAARADRVIKGRAPGIDWQALQALGLGLAGVRIG